MKKGDFFRKYKEWRRKRKLMRECEIMDRITCGSCFQVMPTWSYYYYDQESFRKEYAKIRKRLVEIINECQEADKQSDQK